MAARTWDTGKEDLVMSAVTAEERLKELGISLPKAPTPLGAYVEAVQTGNLLYTCSPIELATQERRLMTKVT